MNSKNNYMFPKKSELKRIEISQITKPLPDLKNSEDSKSVAVGNWIAEWIVSELESGKIEINNVLPSKAEFAYMLGVSIGTVQNALRYIEDLGYVESKQCIGTLVRDHKQQTTSLRKLTSKRDLAIDEIKRYIKTGGFSVGSMLPSSRTIATIIGYPINTTRMALENLSAHNLIVHIYKSSRESGWKILSLDFEVSSTSSSRGSQTLVDMVVKDLENYIINNLKVGDKMPAHGALAKALKASLKTVHDALAILIDRGVLLARRGRYGTTVTRIPGAEMFLQKPETSIFAPAKDTALYHYEKTQNYIKRMIADEYQVGDKLPSIQELADRLDLSPNTIRKAFHNLADEGYLVFSRGRYGGTFIIDIPEVEAQTFKWLAVNPQYAKEYSES